MTVVIIPLSRISFHPFKGPYGLIATVVLQDRQGLRPSLGKVGKKSGEVEDPLSHRQMGVLISMIIVEVELP